MKVLFRKRFKAKSLCSSDQIFKCLPLARKMTVSVDGWFDDEICWNFFFGSQVEILTCSSLHDDDELDAIGLVQGSPPLLVEMSVPEVPTMRVEQSKVVPETIATKCFARLKTPL